MKLFIVAALVSSSAAFAPAVPSGRHCMALASAGPEAIQAAMEASKKYGPTSKEARVLWDIVEEMDASDNSAAFKPAVVDEEYANKVKSLSQMLTKTKDELAEMKKLASQLKGVKLATPVSSGSVSAETSAAMKEAVAAAKAATEKFGETSSEAMLAWETVEEIAASAKDSEASRPSLDEECLIDLIEGCEALEKFKDALNTFETGVFAEDESEVDYIQTVDAVSGADESDIDY